MESMIEKASGNEVGKETTTTMVRYVREVIVNYRGRAKNSVVIGSAMEASRQMRKALPDNSREHVVVLYLDGAHRLIGFAVTSTGTANACHIHPREVFQRAVLLGAVAVIVGHNHPSGQASPSPQDEAVTRVIREAGVVLGITLLDHVIVTADEHVSFAESGRL